MNIRRKQWSHVQELFNILMALGLVSLLLVPGGAVQAQEELPPAPLAPQLTWSNLGTAQQTFEVNGEAVTLSGTTFVPSQAFNLEASEEVSAYYTPGNLEKLGWRYISSTPSSNSVVSAYFHSDGVYTLVKFEACGDETPATCVTVWESAASEIVPSPAAEEIVESEALGTLGKSSPTNGATGVSINPNISWTAYTGTNLSRYRYCIDESNNSSCDASGGWTAVFGKTNADVSSLKTNTKYYWQVQAVLFDDTKISANGGTWWSFNTKTDAVPSSFGKTVPINGATGQPVTPTLAWQASSRATSYEYCVDTIGNNVCDTAWVSTTSTYVTLMSGINTNVIYFWQVRAVNSGGKVEANSGAWYVFSAAAAPANDKVDTALTASVPYESSVNTTSATVDTGTVNACSPALGLASVWYKYTATSNRQIYIDTFGTPYNTFIAVWTKNANGTLNPVTCADDSNGTQQSLVNLTVSSGTTYYFQVAQRNASAPTATPGGNLHFHITSFGDVHGNSPYWKAIEAIYAADITTGCSQSPTKLFCPDANVTRAEMAVFLERAMGNFNPTPNPTGMFADVPYPGMQPTFPAFIYEFYNDGITGGCANDPLRYCPTNNVTRQEMAVFIERALGNFTPNPNPTGMFADVPYPGMPPTFPAFIYEFYNDGITIGCAANPLRFCPLNNVTRQEMAVFIARAFDIPLP